MAMNGEGADRATKIPLYTSKNSFNLTDAKPKICSSLPNNISG